MPPADLRLTDNPKELSERIVAASPFDQFNRWYAEAQAANVIERDTMTLATVSPEGQPSARAVLLKAFDERGATFYTNFQSRKGQELAHNPKAALLFYWARLDRQVRIEGQVERISDAEADAYYRSRPLGSRIGAWASPQSQPLADRNELDQLEAEARQQLGDNPPRPPFWGGYRVVPQRFEFWQGRPSRLHDRLLYERVPHGWQLKRLAP